MDNGVIDLFDEEIATNWFLQKVDTGDFTLFDDASADIWFRTNVEIGRYVLFDPEAATSWFIDNVEKRNFILFDEIAANEWHDRLLEAGLHSFDSNAADAWLATKNFNSNDADQWFSSKLFFDGTCAMDSNFEAENIIDGSTSIDGDLIVKGKICALSYPVLFDSNAAETWFYSKIIFNASCPTSDDFTNAANILDGVTAIDGDLIVNGKICARSFPALFDSNAAETWYSSKLTFNMTCDTAEAFSNAENVIDGITAIDGDLIVNGKICANQLSFPTMFDSNAIREWFLDINLNAFTVSNLWGVATDNSSNLIFSAIDNHPVLTIGESNVNITGSLSLDNYWKQYTGVDSNLVFESRNGALVEFDEIWSAGVLNFTGKHRCYSDIKNPKLGQIVYSKGIYKNLEESDAISIDEALPVVGLTRKKFDKRAIGVIGGVDEVGEYRMGNIKLTKPLLSKRLIIQSHGEGAILVCNINGDIENGDYITSSSVMGYGMRQKSKLKYNHTVAKITQDCKFTSPNTFTITHKGEKYKACLVGCFYEF